MNVTVILKKCEGGFQVYKDNEIISPVLKTLKDLEHWKWDFKYKNFAKDDVSLITDHPKV